MEVTLVSTTKTVSLNGVPARVWEGKTESGIPIAAFITRVMVANELMTDEETERFKKELLECKAPSEEIAAIPLRMVI